MPGPAPTPTAELKLRGSRVVERRAEEPQIDAGIPLMPSGMSKVAVAEWKRITAVLMDRQIVTPIDGDALHLYCETFAKWKKAQAQVMKQGSVIKVRGEAKLNPWNSVADKAALMCKALLEQFGQTPASRTRVHATPAKKEDGVMVRDRFMKLAQ